MNKIILLVLTFFISLNIANCQVNLEAMAQQKLQELGLDETEVRGKLIERGIDIDNVDQNNVAEVQKVQVALEEIVAELQAEKKQKTKENAVKELSGEHIDNIKKEITSGGNLEEAIAEEAVEVKVDKTPSPIYGQEIFRGNNIKLYRQAKDIKPSANYVLGSGDQIAISIWGQSHENAVYEVSKAGFIQPTGMGRIYLSGLTLTKAKKLLMSKYLQYYRFRSEEFELTIAQSRTISVNIVGEVVNFGSFTIPSINTAFNALVASGGPSTIGSVRRIELKRAGEPSKTMDTYKFLNDPSTADDFYLQENDYLYVPVAEKVVDIKGAINRPYKYELLDNENLIQLVKWAGGLKANAYTKVFQIERYSGDKKIIIDVNYADLLFKNTDFKLVNGDIITINEVDSDVENYVEISGAVDFPQQFELKKDMRIFDLIKKGKLNENAITNYAYIRHIRPDQSMIYERIDLAKILTNPNGEENVLLAKKDKIIIHSKSTFVDNESISIVGAVRNPVKVRYDLGKNLRVSDLIEMAGGVKEGVADFAFLYRKDDQNDKAVIYKRINLKEVLKNNKSVENIELKPMDKLRIMSKSTFTDATVVSISGLVRQPGDFVYDHSLKISDLIEMAGGLKREASASRIDVFRINFKDEISSVETITLELDDSFHPINVENFSLQPFDEIVVRRIADFELLNKITIKGEVKYPGAYAIKKNERVLSILKRSGGPSSEAFLRGATLYRKNEDVGYIIMKLDEVLNSSKSPFNYLLKAGDIIDIPKSKDIVTIMGATNANDLYKDDILKEGKVNVAFIKGKNAKYYVEHYAAGVNDKGRNKLISVEHPNGEVQRTKNFLLFKVYPKVREGSIVRVGAKRVKKKEGTPGEKKNVDWNKVFSDSIAQISAILTVILLVERIN